MTAVYEGGIEMSYRIGAASTDGKVVNQHFGHADRFHIVELFPETGEYKYIETRKITPCCHGGEHDNSSFDAVISNLSDVQALLVSRVGDGAADYLEAKGLTVYQAPFPIEPLIKKIISDKLWEADQWREPAAG